MSEEVISSWGNSFNILGLFTKVLFNAEAPSWWFGAVRIRSGGLTWPMRVSGNYEAGPARWLCRAHFWVSPSLLVHGGPGRTLGTSAVEGRKRLWDFASREAGVQLNGLYVNAIWNVLGCPFDVPLPALVGRGLPRGRGRSEVPCKASDGTRCFTADCWEDSYVQRRKSYLWGSGWAGELQLPVNQAILCNCQLDDFMSRRRLLLQQGSC